jgi:integrase
MRKRFQNGSVKKSKDGKYWIGSWREDDGKGSRTQRSRVLGKTSRMNKTGAKEKMADIVKPINDRAATAISTNIELKQFVEDVYLPFYKKKWKQSTAMTNEDRITHFIVPEFGSRRLSTLTRDDLQQFLDSKSSLSFSTVDHLRWDLKQMFDMAVAEGVLPRNPAAILFTPRACPRPERRSLTIEEVKKVFSVLADLRDRLIVKLAILGGMRPGEIFGLRRGGFAECVTSIHERVYRGIIDTPKTEKSTRIAALSSGLRRDLEAWLMNSPDSGPNGWLFPSANLKTPISRDNVMYRNIRPVLEKEGFGWVDFHVMRRTHSSLMRELGVDPKVVADQQGHTLDVNLNVYTETSVKSRIEAVETLESAFVN